MSPRANDGEAPVLAPFLEMPMRSGLQIDAWEFIIRAVSGSEVISLVFRAAVVACAEIRLVGRVESQEELAAGNPMILEELAQ